MILHLVGSRFYGTHRPDSDFDYIGRNDKETIDYCLKLGLRKLDSNQRIRYVGHGMDVCLYDNVERYIKARDILAECPEAKMSKDIRHNKLMEIIDGMVR